MVFRLSSLTYYIGKSVDTMVGKGCHAAQLIKILGLLAGILLVTVLSQWLIQRLGNRVSIYRPHS